MKVLVDVSLPPAWVVVLARHGIDAIHWTTIGDPFAKDAVVIQ